MESAAYKYLNLCRSIINKTITPDEGFTQYELELVGNDSLGITSLLLDVLSVVDTELAVDKNVEGQKLLMQFVNRINNRTIPEEILRMELESMGANDASTRARIIRAKTRLFYKQVKFNLFREENEGFAKLICELFRSDQRSVESMKKILRGLIGRFSLDPNRVVDIILEAFEALPHKKSFFIPLLNYLKGEDDVVCATLGFKFTFYRNTENTPVSLYNLAAVLCIERIVDVSTFCGYLVPTPQEIENEYERRLARELRRAKRAEFINTSQLPADSRPVNLISAEEVFPSTIATVSFGSVAASQEIEDRKFFDGDVSTSADALVKNQKLGVMLSLLGAGAWSTAKEMLDFLPEDYAVEASKEIALSISDLIERSIDDFYHEKCKYGIDETTPDSVAPSSFSLEIVGRWSDLESVVLPVLSYVGPFIAYHQRAAIKLIRLLTVFFGEQANDPVTEDTSSNHSESLSDAFINATDEYLLPSLSLSCSNAAYSEELWNLLSHFPYTTRYRMYSNWKTIHTANYPKINVCRSKVLGMSRYVVKRLSKETVRMMGRQLGKLCHIHPSVVFDYILDQIQTFENLIEPVVDSIRFLTNLEYDVLSFCIIEHLAAPDKQQLKASDGSLSSWILSLATFIGSVFIRYNMEMDGMLNYVANQLKNEQSYDLLVLREIIRNLSGIESTTGLTNEQIEALAGGDALRQEAGSFSVVRTNRKAVIRLREALLRDDLMVGLSVLTAQQRQFIVFVQSADIPLKLAGTMLDQCQETVVQFGSFLKSHIRLEDYYSRMPNTPELISTYHLNVDAAFHLSRPVFMYQVYTIFDRNRKALREADGTKKIDVNRKFELFSDAFGEVIEDLEAKLVQSLPDHLWNDVSTEIFILFWVLTMYDISTPKAAYEREFARVKRAIAACTESTEGKTKRAKEEEQLKVLEKRLSDEYRKQIDHVERMLGILRNDKEHLFANCTSKTRGAQMALFLQICVLPRAFFTEFDATYCARFIHILHQQRTGFFQTVFFFDRLFDDVAIILAPLSENEANCFGRFVCLILEIIQHWHSDPAIFEKECYRYPGFMTKLLVRNPESYGDTLNDGMNYEAYRTICHKWQYRLTLSCIGILDEPRYTLLRNSLIFLTKVSAYFPLIENHVATIELKVNKVRDNEKGSRDDISLLAASYAGLLKMRKARVFAESEFHNRIEPMKCADPLSSPKIVEQTRGNDHLFDSLDESLTLKVEDDDSAAVVLKETTPEFVYSRRRVVESLEHGARKKLKQGEACERFHSSRESACADTESVRQEVSLNNTREEGELDVSPTPQRRSRSHKSSDDETGRREREKSGLREELREEKRGKNSISRAVSSERSNGKGMKGHDSVKRGNVLNENESVVAKVPHKKSLTPEKVYEARELRTLVRRTRQLPHRNIKSIHAAPR